MANDHYVSRFQTRPWEVGARRLHYYNFAESSFGESSSESLFAKNDLHSEGTGKLLNRIIESHTSNYRARALRVGSQLIDPGDWRVFRALVGLIWMQVQRTIDARDPSAARLDAVLERGESFIDELARIAQETQVLVGVTLPAHEHMFFVDTGFFAIPIAAEEPIYGIPLTPHHFISLPKKDYDQEQLTTWINMPGMISAFSIGFGARMDRVVIPPQRIPFRDKDPSQFAQVMIETRENARKMVRLIGEAGRIAGLPAWTAT